MWDRRALLGWEHSRWQEGDPTGRSASRSPSPNGPKRGPQAVKASAEVHLDGLKKGRPVLGQVQFVRNGASAVGRGADVGRCQGAPGGAAVVAVMRGSGRSTEHGTRPDRRPKRDEDPVAEARAAMNQALDGVSLGSVVFKNPVPPPAYRATQVAAPVPEPPRTRQREASPTHMTYNNHGKVVAASPEVMQAPPKQRTQRSEPARNSRLSDMMNLPSDPVPPKRRNLPEEQMSLAAWKQYQKNGMKECEQEDQENDPAIKNTPSELELMEQQMQMQLVQQEKIRQELFECAARRKGQKMSPRDMAALNLRDRLSEKEKNEKERVAARAKEGGDPTIDDPKNLENVFIQMALVYDAAKEQFKGLEVLQRKHNDHAANLRDEVVLWKDKSEHLWQELDYLRQQYNDVALMRDGAAD